MLESGAGKTAPAAQGTPAEVAASAPAKPAAPAPQASAPAHVAAGANLAEINQSLAAAASRLAGLETGLAASARLGQDQLAQQIRPALRQAERDVSAAGMPHQPGGIEIHGVAKKRPRLCGVRDDLTDGG